MKRSLAAVLAADVAGYSKLIGQDTEGTLAALRRVRSEILRPTVASRRGRVVKNMGDGWIVLFDAASDAATCALQIQDLLAQDVDPQKDPMLLRLGLHVGDVVEEDEDVFGDGVNVAARLEELAAPGSIAISDAVFGSLDGTLRPSFDDAGEHELKNIAKPVHVWTRGSLPQSSTVFNKKIRRPQIVISPIQTSDKRENVVELCDALSGDLMTFIGATHWLSVATRRSNRPCYHFSGRLRASGDRVRLEVKFVGPEGTGIASCKVDGSLEDAFDWQDHTAEQLVNLILTATFDQERRQLDVLSVSEMTAHQCELRGQIAIDRLDPNAFAAALKYSSAAIDKDPQLPHPFALGLVAFLSARVMGYDDVADAYVAMIPGWCEKAGPLVEDHALLQLALGVTTYARHRDPTRLRVIVANALRQSSCDFVTLALCGWSNIWIGDIDDALDCLTKATALGGKSPWGLAIQGGLAMANLQAGNDSVALEIAQKGIHSNGGYATMYRVLASAHALLGNMSDARNAVDMALELQPDDSIESIVGRNVFATSDTTNRYITGLRTAGMRERL